MVSHSNGGPCRGVPEFLDGLRVLPKPPMLGLLTGNIRLVRKSNCAATALGRF